MVDLSGCRAKETLNKPLGRRRRRLDNIQTTHNQLPHTEIPGRAKMSFRAPSMSTVAKVVGRLKNRNTQKHIFPPCVIMVSEAVVTSIT